MCRFAILLLALAPCSVAAQATSAPPAPDAATIRTLVDSLARDFVESGQAPGISVQVTRGPDTLVRAGYGKADLEQDVDAGPGTLYEIGSITKQFTSAAVMRLSEAGRLSLDDSIAAYVAGLPAAWRGVTIRQLLNHTSGIPSYTDIGARWQDRFREDMPPDTLVALTALDTLWFAPGTDWRYDNSGYVVLGMLLDTLTGEPYPRYIESELVRPLGLQHTFYCDDQRILPGRAPGYQKAEGGWQHAPFLSMTQPYSAGALCSTVGDLARWNGLLASGAVVSPDSYRRMTTPVGAAAAHRYGFGLTLDSVAGHPVVSHGGGIPGFITSNAYVPDRKISVTVLTNSGGASPDLLLRSILRVMLGLPLESRPQRITLSAEQRAAYPGHYTLTLPDGRPVAVEIMEVGDRLEVQPEGQQRFELIPFEGGTFGAEFDPSLRISFRVEDGRATGFTLVQGRTEMTAERNR